MTILAAISGEYQQDQVVEIGYDLAEAYDTELVVLHVMDQDQFEEIRDSEELPPDRREGSSGEQGREDHTAAFIVGWDGDPISYIPSERNSFDGSEYNLADAASDSQRVAEKCVENTLTADRKTSVTFQGRVGDIAPEIIDEAERIDAQYVVVGGRNRSPTGKAIFGSISQSVILNSDRPVVASTRNE